MKTKLILFLLISINLFAQKNLTNSGYVNIKGTKLYIIPPKGFKESKNMVGLEKNETALIQVMDLVGGNFDSNTSTYTRAEFEKKGITVLEFKELEIDGYKAKFSHIKGADSNESLQLVFGDSTFSAMVMALYPSNLRNELYKDIKAAFLKIKYDKTLVIDPFSSSAFKVEKHESKFKFAKATANMFIFSENGEVKDAYVDEPMMMITSVPFDKSMTKEELVQEAVNGLVNQGFVKKDKKNLSKKMINGYDTVEVEYYFEHKSEIKLMFITVLVKKDKALLIYGSSKSNFEENITEFKKLTNKIIIK
jgi:hypothetical protein